MVAADSDHAACPCGGSHEQHAHPNEVSAVAHTTTENSHTADLREWLNQWRASPDEAKLDAGRALAETRRDHMAKLIEHDPAQAVANMLSFQEYLDLPAEIYAIIEQPFAATANVDAFPLCLDPSHNHTDSTPELTYVADLGDERVRLYLPPARAGMQSKQAMPIGGLQLDGKAALFPEAARELSAGEAKAAQELLGLTQRGAATDTHLALIGDELWGESTLPGIGFVDACLTQAEESNGPTSVQSVMQLLEDGELDEASLAQSLEVAASLWTETPKRVLFVRVNFNNLSGVESASSVHNKLAKSSYELQRMSYGKTWLSTTHVTDTA
ncbi:MAG: hypothetical protein ACQKBV_08545, partial [Puniceicoccales bacterium]